MNIHVWPDDLWCTDEDLADYLQYLSDDYVTLVLSDNSDETDILKAIEVLN